MFCGLDAGVGSVAPATRIRQGPYTPNRFVRFDGSGDRRDVGLWRSRNPHRIQVRRKTIAKLIAVVFVFNLVVMGTDAWFAYEEAAPIPRYGAFEGRFGAAAEAAGPFEFSADALSDVPYREIEDPRFQAGAVDPVSMDAFRRASAEVAPGIGTRSGDCW